MSSAAGLGWNLSTAHGKVDNDKLYASTSSLISCRLSSRSPLGGITWLAETKQFGKQQGIS